MSGLAGESVRLPCEIDKNNCGGFHNIKWYKSNQRVFIFSELANVRRPEGGILTERYAFLLRIDFHRNITVKVTGNVFSNDINS